MPTNLITCPACDHTLIDGAKFCNKCGVAVPVPAAETATAQASAGFCPSCGAPAPAGSTTCLKCGKPLVGGEPAVSIPPTPPATKKEDTGKKSTIGCIAIVILLVGFGACGLCLKMSDEEGKTSTQQESKAAPSAQPAAPKGRTLGVSCDDFMKTKAFADFVMKKRVLRYGGTALSGEIKTESVTLEFVGDCDDVETAYLRYSPGSDKQTNALNTLRVIMLMSVAVPEWKESMEWFNKAMKNALKVKGQGESEYKESIVRSGKRITFQWLDLLSSISVNIERTAP